MNRNLITRMGTASGVVAALVATVFAVLVTAVRDLRSATDRARASERAVVTATRAQAQTETSDLARRVYLRTGDPAYLGPVRDAQRALPASDRELRALLHDDADARGALGAMSAAQTAYASGLPVAPTPGRRGGQPPTPARDINAQTARANTLRSAFERVISASSARANRERSSADTSAGQAVALGIGGLIGSALLIALLTTYLTQYIVVPLRRVGRAARRLAQGELSARVIEEGDAEPVELARSFNAMAESLEQNRSDLESQNAELAAQQTELEQALSDLAAEKHRIEVFHRAGERLAGEIELDAVAEVALRELCDATGAEVGALYVAREQGDGRLGLLATRGLDRERLAAVLSVGDGLAGRAAKEGRAMTAEHPEAGLEVMAFGQRVGVRHELHVPIRLGERVIGVMSMARLGERPFVYEQLQTVERLAEQAAVALANVLSYRRAVQQARINRAVLQATPDPIGLFAPDGSLVVENAPMAELRRVGHVEQVDGDPEQESRDELTVSDRTYARYAAPVHDAPGALMGRIVVLRDITAERESERLKDEFFALVSHELRTPLTSIIGYLELVLDDAEEIGADSRRSLEVVERNAKRLLRLVGDMLFVAQVEAGRLSLERAPVDLGLIATESVEAALPSAERAGVGLSIEAEPVRTLIGDGDRFAQMLDNLVSNALKFTPREGQVVVRVMDAGDHAVVEVSDTGLGIPADEQGRLFERFFRASRATERAVPGAGLGLTIVKTIAEVHGGDVEVASRDGEGATFRIRLPYRAGAIAEPGPQRMTSPAIQ